MASDPSSRPSFQIKEVFKLSLTLLTQNVCLLLVFVVLAYIIIVTFLTDWAANLPSHPFFAPIGNWLSESEVLSCANDENQEFIKVFFKSSIYSYSFAHSVFLAIVTSKLIYNVLLAGRSEIFGKDFTSCYTDGPIFLELSCDILRTIGVIVCYIVVFFTYSFFARFVIGLVDESVRLYFILVFAVITIPSFWYVGSRCLLSIPVTVIEKMNPWKSFKRSWHLTAACRRQMFAVMVSTGLLYIVIPIVLSIERLICFDLKDVKLSELPAALPDPILAINQLFFAGLIGLPSSVIMSVCYYFVRKAEDGNSTEAEPASP